MNVPGLGISGTDYIDEVETDDEEETEEIFMRLPLCAKAGVYDVDVQVTYDEAHRTTRKSTKVKVRENPQCQELAAANAQNNVEVVVAASATDNVESPGGEKSSKSRVRAALETLVIILVGLLVIVALVIAFNKLKTEEDEEDY